MQIGEISSISGFSKDTLRYYEKIGLIELKKNNRGFNNYRIYDGTLVQKLLQIQKLKAAGFTLNEMKDLYRQKELEMITCDRMEKMVRVKIFKIEEQIIKLKKQRAILQSFSEKCIGKCEEVIF